MLAQVIKKHKLSLLLLSFLVSAAYLNSLNNAFLSDDLAEIVQNPNIGKFGNIFTHTFGYIRPFLYWLIFHTGGLNPILFRLSNVLFHLGSVFLVYLLFNHLFSRRLAIFTAALFAVHPAIAEAVVWISGGMYAQYVFFFLLSFLLYILAPKKNLFYLLSYISYLLSFMSHPQMPLALFLIFPIFELSFGNFKKNWVKTLPFLFISLLFIIITLSALPERENTLQSTHYQQKGMYNPIVTIPISITSYFEMIFFPKDLTLYHSELPVGNIQVLIRLVIALVLFGTIFISYRKNKFIFFWLLFFLIALSPTLTPFKLNWLVAERYLYLPFIGVAALISLGLDKLLIFPKLKEIIYILFAIIIIVLTSRTIIRNIDWKSEDNLWIATGKTSPSSPNTHNNLGDVYGRHGDKQAALKEFQKAIELKPDYGDAYHNLANTYRELGDLEKALENYQKALQFNPNLWQSYQNIGALYFEQKKFDLALKNMQKAVQISPRDLSLHYAIGVVYLKMGEKDKAREIFNQLLIIDPNNQILKQALQETIK